MILHQQLLSGAAERVLIIVPETLQHQWLVEMLRRFNLRFALFDDERYAEAQHDAYNPFDTEQLVICSLDFARRSKQRLEHLCEAEWDLLVVDEAHHRCGAKMRRAVNIRPLNNWQSTCRAFCC